MTEIRIRSATGEDAAGIALVLHALFVAGLRRRDATADWVRARYIDDPNRVLAQVAVDDQGRVLGLQSLTLATVGNIYGAPPGWGVIGTHIAPDALRRGIGRRFFEASVRAARAAGLPAIEAGVGIGVPHAQGYYTAMGFESYRRDKDTDFKVYRLPEG